MAFTVMSHELRIWSEHWTEEYGCHEFDVGEAFALYQTLDDLVCFLEGVQRLKFPSRNVGYLVPDPAENAKRIATRLRSDVLKHFANNRSKRMADAFDGFAKECEAVEKERAALA